TPCAVFEGLVHPRCLLNGRNVLPGLIVAWTVSMMQCIEDPKLRLSRSIEDLHHMRNTLIGFSDALHAIPSLPPSEMKSLYGSITRSAVISLSYVIGASILSSQHGYQDCDGRLIANDYIKLQFSRKR